jgi:hypothetical protein
LEYHLKVDVLDPYKVTPVMVLTDGGFNHINCKLETVLLLRHKTKFGKRVTNNQALDY